MLLIALSLFIVGTAVKAQAIPQDEFVRLEKRNSAKTKRFYVGEKVKYKTEYHDWKFGLIEKLDFINQMIYFSTGPVRIDDIIGIQSKSQAYWAKYLRLNLQVFGVGVLFFSVFNPLAGLPYPTWALIVGPGAYGLGWLLGKIFEQNYYRVGTKWNIRLIDLSFD
jgi:hypothetical protein